VLQKVFSAQLSEEGMDLKEYLSEVEISLIKQALDECNGVVAHASYSLVEKLKKLDM